MKELYKATGKLWLSNSGEFGSLMYLFKNRLEELYVLKNIHNNSEYTADTPFTKVAGYISIRNKSGLLGAFACKKVKNIENSRKLDSMFYDPLDFTYTQAKFKREIKINALVQELKDGE